MRPYQIVATERILNRIEIANNYKKYGTVEGGGYIWHTQVVEKHLPHLRLLDLQLRFLTLIKFYLLLIEKT